MLATLKAGDKIKFDAEQMNGQFTMSKDRKVQMTGASLGNTETGVLHRKYSAYVRSRSDSIFREIGPHDRFTPHELTFY